MGQPGHGVPERVHLGPAEVAVLEVSLVAGLLAGSEGADSEEGRLAPGATVDDARAKLGYELFYILNRSLTFYFAVGLETLKVLVFRRGAR